VQSSNVLFSTDYWSDECQSEMPRANVISSIEIVHVTQAMSWRHDECDCWSSLFVTEYIQYPRWSVRPALAWPREVSAANGPLPSDCLPGSLHSCAVLQACSTSKIEVRIQEKCCDPIKDNSPVVIRVTETSGSQPVSVVGGQSSRTNLV
jgi:hypothetical protein